MDAIEDIPISALEHYSYCPRQFGLIHIERVWDENELTLQGARAHDRVDVPIMRHERCRDVWRAVPLWSRRLNLFGRADAIQRLEDGSMMPVEYKRGGRKECEHERIQLCAQALCLEEMLEVQVLSGSLFHSKSKKLVSVEIDGALRLRTEALIGEVQTCFDDAVCPPAIADIRCEECSLRAMCLPELASSVDARSPDAIYVRADMSEWVEEP